MKPVTENLVLNFETLGHLANTEPFYKWNSTWTRTVQDAITIILLSQFLGSSSLFTLEQLGEVLHTPVNLKNQDAFHITIEEYLLAIVSMIDELVRYARNCVTLGDYRMPLVISRFAKEVLAGFQILNLKNDIVRRRSDGLKYKVR